jgi:hypothetical protein
VHCTHASTRSLSSCGGPEQRSSQVTQRPPSETPIAGRHREYDHKQITATSELLQTPSCSFRGRSVRLDRDRVEKECGQRCCVAKPDLADLSFLPVDGSMIAIWRARSVFKPQRRLIDHGPVETQRRVVTLLNCLARELDTPRRGFCSQPWCRVSPAVARCGQRRHC